MKEHTYKRKKERKKEWKKERINEKQRKEDRKTNRISFWSVDGTDIEHWSVFDLCHQLFSLAARISWSAILFAGSQFPTIRSRGALFYNIINQHHHLPLKKINYVLSNNFLFRLTRFFIWKPRIWRYVRKSFNIADGSWASPFFYYLYNNFAFILFRFIYTLFFSWIQCLRFYHFYRIRTM